MVNKKVITHFGFYVRDEATPYYQLVVKDFETGAVAEKQSHRFMDSARSERLEGAKGLDFFYSPGCPFNAAFTKIMADIGEEMGYPVRIHRLETREDLEKQPNPWGLFNVFIDGECLSAEVMVGNKFQALLESKAG